MRIPSTLRIAFATLTCGLAALGLAACTMVEHPEHPAQPATPPAPTLEDVAVFLEKHVAEQSAASADQRYHFSNNGQDMSLALALVHRERLAKTAPDQYFICADFAGTDGTTYDIDLWVSWTGGQLAVAETTLHKINGQALYTWYEEDGIWKRRMVEGTQPASSGAEQPADKPAKKRRSRKKKEPVQQAATETPPATTEAPAPGTETGEQPSTK